MTHDKIVCASCHFCWLLFPYSSSFFLFYAVVLSIDFSFIHFEPFDGISKIAEWLNHSAAVSEHTHKQKRGNKDKCNKMNENKPKWKYNKKMNESVKQLTATCCEQLAACDRLQMDAHRRHHPNPINYNLAQKFLCTEQTNERTKNNLYHF